MAHRLPLETIRESANLEVNGCLTPSRMRVAALLPFGNREASDNWDIMDLPPQIKILG